MKNFKIVPAAILGGLIQVLVAVGIFSVSAGAQAHDSCPPAPDAKHPATHPHCADDSGGNGNGGDGSPTDIVGTSGDDGGGPDPANILQCLDPDQAIFGTEPVVGGASGDDGFAGIGGNDCFVGGEGPPLDTSDLTWGNDSFHGGDGDDWMLGGDGNDSFSPEGGFNVMLGNGGDDYFFADGDYVDGGDGFDILNYNAFGQLIVNWTDGAVLVDGVSYPAHTITNIAVSPPVVDQVYSIEDIIGSPNADVIFGSDAVEHFSPRRGDDYIDAGGGDDRIYADRGNDTVIGGPGSDFLRGAENRDRFEFRPGDFAAGGEADVIDDFSARHDCIAMNGIVPSAINLETPGEGGSDQDTVLVISVAATPSTIRLRDATVLDLAAVSCP